VDDHSVSADEFERWMQAQGVRFAAGKPGESRPTVPPPTAKPLPAEPPATTAAGDVLLQIGSFSARDNADRARERLQAGGVEALRIDEATVNGQPVWRLRIGPVPSSRVQELSSRAADLGFGSAQIVRD
jgi:rare lipoprotein A